MSEIPSELFQFETIQYLPIKDILHLCSTSSTFYQICQENGTWQYLLYRDFGHVDPTQDPRGEYMWLYENHQIFDISLQTVIEIANVFQVKVSDLITLLEFFGYEQVKDHFEWRVLPTELFKEKVMSLLSFNQPILGGMEISTFSEVMNEFHFPEEGYYYDKRLKDALKNLLPLVFHLNRNEFYIFLQDFVTWYDVLYGHGAFAEYLRNDPHFGPELEPAMVKFMREIY